jgi:hypothetical protein
MIVIRVAIVVAAVVAVVASELVVGAAIWAVGY